MKKLVFIVFGLLFFPLFAELKTAADVHQLLANKKLTAEQNDQLLSFAKKKFKKIDLKDPNHRPSIHKNKDGGGTVAWFFEAKSGSKVEIFAEKKRHWPMREIGQSGIYVASETFPNFTSVHFRYTVNGFRHKMAKFNRFGFESYTFGPMSLKQDGVPEGKLIEMGVYKATDEFFKGTERKWWIYVPAQYDKSVEAKLIFFNDGGGFIKGEGNASTVMDNLIHAKKMPVSIGVFVNPGEIKTAKRTIRNRGNEYDTCTPKFANFLEKEILPQVYEKYNVSKKAEDHVICGSSSGASCAFTAAWHRNDLFNKVVSFVGSYCDFRPINDYPLKDGEKSEYGPFKTAHDYPALIRKTVPNKKIKIYLQDGINDLDNTLGNWYKNNERMADALAFSGYTFKFKSGKGMHSKRHGMSILPEILEWIWQE
ncbi:MAG: alpha/beta hydrolase-fold protein [Lentisphaeraceae bacterium]|nr:alpha/beta hydrolase-fold protein [Lentisphaeraceae bacterium]